MATTTSRNLSRLRAVADENSLRRLGGHQIDWTLVTAVDSDNRKVVPAGTVMGKKAGDNLLVPRSITQSITGISVVGTTATATKTAHGLAVGDRITISGATPSWLNASWTVATVADANTFTFTVTPPAAITDARAVTLTISTDLVGLTAHGLSAGAIVEFEAIATTTGLTAGTNYYVIATGLTADAFSVSTTAGGSAVDLAGGNGTALMRVISGGTYTATGTILAAWSAVGILETDAHYQAPGDSLSGYGLLGGGVLYDNLLADATGSPKAVLAAYKTELTAAGCLFQFVRYVDNRAS